MENSNFVEDCSGWGMGGCRTRKPSIVWEPTLGSTNQHLGLSCKNSGEGIKEFSSENVRFLYPASHSCCQWKVDNRGTD